MKNSGSTSTPNSDNQAHWDFEAQEFPLPNNGGIGRLQCFDFNNGLILYRSEFRVKHECVLISDAAQGDLCELLCSILLLSGDVLLETPDGQRHTITTHHGLLFRVRYNGTRIILRGGQTVRHVGVTCNISALYNRLNGALPTALTGFSTFPESGVVSCPLPVQNRLRALMADVFSPLGSAGDPLDEMALEGVSLSILAEMIRLLAARDSTGASRTSLWGEQIFDDLTDYIRTHVALPLKSEDICQKFGISKRQLQQLFQANLQCSPRDFLRRERVTQARELMERDGMSVKAAAHAVGYNHVSNFGKAYRDFFGETPGHTLRLSNTDTTTENAD